MRYWIVVLVFWLGLSVSHSQVRIGWEIPSSDPNEGSLETLQMRLADSEGTLYVWGQRRDKFFGTYEGYTAHDVEILKIHPDGSILWDWRFDGDDYLYDHFASWDYATSFAVDSLGNPIVTIASYVGSYHYSSLIKLDRDQQIVWSLQDTQVSWQMGVDPQNNVVLATPAPQWMLKMTKYNSEGNLLWERQEPSYSTTPIFGLTFAPIGNLFAISEQYALQIRKYSPEGVRLWERAYPTGDGWVLYHRLFTDQSGNVYAVAMASREVGSNGEMGGFGVVLVSYDPDGNLRWSNWYIVPDQTTWYPWSGTPVVFNEAQNAFYLALNVGRQQTDEIGAREHHVVKFRLSDGEMLSETLLTFPERARHTALKALTVDAQGRAYVLSVMARRIDRPNSDSAWRLVDPQMGIFRVDTEGQQEWLYVHPRLDARATHILMGPRNTFYVGELWYISRFDVLPVRSDGDVNGDGCVDDADLAQVIFAFGTEDAPSDVTGDGFVDDTDLTRVVEHFGFGCED